MKKLSIVIVNWDSADSVKKQLELHAEQEYDIVVVDNKSKHSIKSLEKTYPDVAFIHNHINKGYAAGCNTGFIHTHTEWILFLNPDTYITPENVTRLLSYAQEHNLDACSPEPKTESYKKPLPTVKSLVKEFSPIKIPGPLSQYNTLFGGGLLIKSSALHDLGGWDERFFLWFEDSDLTKRLIDGGYNIGWAPVDIDHEGGTSFKQVEAQFKRDVFFLSMRAYSQKHFGSPGNALIHMLARRYTTSHVLPDIEKGISITIPNMRADQLSTFFKDNANLLEKIDDVIVVTSALSSMELWTYRKNYPRIRFVPIDHNRGFAHTVNIGFRCSVGEWIGTINDDVILPSSHADWAKTLVRHALKHSDTAGSINPVVRTQSGEVESAGVIIFPHGKAQPVTTIEDTEVFPTDATNAAAVLYSREALQDAGIFDERFGSYLEDIDLSLRLASYGYLNLVDPSISITHLGQQTSSGMGRKKQWLDFKNWILVIGKNWSLSQLITHAPQITLERLRNISGILKG